MMPDHRERAAGREEPRVEDAQRWLAYERTHLANERTFAAWLRTGLSVAAVGIALSHFLPTPLRVSGLSVTLGACFVLAGIGLIVFGARRFVRTQRALADAGWSTGSVSPGMIYGIAALLAALLLAVSMAVR
jgi:putative membrane protein